jgi:hypothetical protein
VILFQAGRTAQPKQTVTQETGVVFVAAMQSLQSFEVDKSLSSE